MVEWGVKTDPKTLTEVFVSWVAIVNYHLLAVLREQKLVLERWLSG